MRPWGSADEIVEILLNSVNHHHIDIGIVDEAGVLNETCCRATFHGCPFWV